MSEHNFTAPIPPGKPANPSLDFPLTPHAPGCWCKKIKGKVRYFGRWTDPQGALAEYRAFLSGEPPPNASAPPPEPTWLERI